MKLVDLLVKELANRGGWPEGALSITQDNDGSLCVWDTNDPHYDGFSWKHHTGNSLVCYWHGEGAIPLSFDYNESIATYWQYKEALAARKAVVGRDGWIQWAGGECPIDSDAIVEVKYRKPNPYQFNNDRAGDYIWLHTGSDGDIIAYRLQQPTKSEHACDDAAENDDEADLNECIGQDVDMPEWNGEGLPPVGLICEGRFPRHPGISFEWQECLVLYVFERECAVKSKSTSTLHYCDEFRPLRTEAEKAREDAETAIRTCLAGTGAGITPLAAKGIYEAIAEGKIPGVKLEDK